MRIYTFGDNTKPVISLLPGTCCHWKANFDRVLPLLKPNFHVACVSYDGFDETEQSVFPNMLPFSVMPTGRRPRLFTVA